MTQLLLIEDNLEMRENTAEMLELANYEVLIAENGKIGIQLAKQHQPDLIICDIMMPGMDGYEVLFMLGKDPSTAGIPFVFLTAKAEKSDLRKGMNLGADDYITKPFEEKELLGAIETRLKRSEIISRQYSSDLDGLNQFLEEARGIKELSKLTAEHKIRPYKKKETIFHEDDYPNRLLFISEGKVKTWKMNEEGKELVTGIHETGDFLGYIALLEDAPYKESATAMEDTEVTLIPRDDFIQLVTTNRDVAHKFIKMLSRSVSANEERLLKLAYASVRERVADAILTLHERNVQSGTEAGIRISRDNLAGIVGTATESLIRTLSDFKDKGLIESKGRELKIVDLEKLKSVANS